MKYKKFLWLLLPYFTFIISYIAYSEYRGDRYIWDVPYHFPIFVTMALLILGSIVIAIDKIINWDMEDGR